jgi:pyridoxine 5-phosphate synthase
MTDLSVNLNKIALLRNSRGRDYPNVVAYAQRFIELGVQGITIHPRSDERHIKRQDAYDLASALKSYDEIELNIEGYPSEDFLELIEATKPDQCTLVPDAEDQLTSDHGWDFHAQSEMLQSVISRLKQTGVRVAVFLDPDLEQVELAAKSGADRIELYTESYAESFSTDSEDSVLRQFHLAAVRAQELGLGVNAGHDLDLANLSAFLTIPKVLEVSIGHALTIECINQGIEQVVSQYLAICDGSA